MINKHKFIEINVSDEEYDIFIQLAASLDLTPSNVISQFVSDLVTGEEASADGSSIAMDWFTALDENCRTGAPFVSWLAENDKLNEAMLHLESVFKTIRRVRHPGVITDGAVYLLLSSCNTEFLVKYADRSLPPAAVRLEPEEWPGYARETLRNLECHYAEIRKLYDGYAADTDEPAPFEESVNMLQCWFEHVYKGI